MHLITDWSSWTPTDRATLCYIVRDGSVLLIEKKRGHGAGKVNAPGGRIEPGETPLDCVVRECVEELLITPHAPERAGELSFQFHDGYSLHCTVFRAEDFDGTPTETDEAVPLWCPLDAIPYSRMWADDAHWLPLLIERTPFTGRFHFRGDTMLTMSLLHSLDPKD